MLYTEIVDILPSPDSSSPSQFTVIDNVLYFKAFDPEHGEELWKYDGTTGQW